jgi:hypothetical protein
MSELIAPTPFINCYVRNEFLFDQHEGHGDFTEGYIFGFRAIPARIPAFQVMLVNGAQWANVPIHQVVVKEGAPVLPPEVCAWWDCFSSRFEVVEFPLLKNLRCSCMGRDRQLRQGNYLFTVDWVGLWADIPDQHKQHHVIALQTGQIVAYPNNKVRWLDESYVDPSTEMPRYRVNTRAWSVEGDVPQPEPGGES